MAVPAITAAIYLPAPAIFPAIFISSTLLLANFPVLGYAVIQSLRVRVRSMGYAFHAVAIRLIGDAISPPLMGRIADRTGSLQTAYLTAVAAVALAAVILLYGWRYAPQPQIAEARAAASGVRRA